MSPRAVDAGSRRGPSVIMQKFLLKWGAFHIWNYFAGNGALDLFGC